MTFSLALASPKVVNINKADAAALSQSLVGIGPLKAEAIVNYRKKHGKFKSTKDLKKVPGIGEALFKKNTRYFSTSKGAVKGDAKKFAAARKKAKAAQGKKVVKKKTTGKKVVKKKTTTKKKVVKKKKK